MHIDSQRLGDFGTGLLTVGVVVGFVVVFTTSFVAGASLTGDPTAALDWPTILATLLGLGLLLSPMLITSGATLIAVAKALTLPTPADPDTTPTKVEKPPSGAGKRDQTPLGGF